MDLLTINEIFGICVKRRHILELVRVPQKMANGKVVFLTGTPCIFG